MQVRTEGPISKVVYERRARFRKAMLLSMAGNSAAGG
jgi:hypothetical protein